MKRSATPLPSGSRTKEGTIMAPTYMSGDFQDEIECLGIEASPSFVREPEGNGVAERFIRTSHGDVQVKGVVLG